MTHSKIPNPNLKCFGEVTIDTICKNLVKFWENYILNESVSLEMKYIEYLTFRSTTNQYQEICCLHFEKASKYLKQFINSANQWFVECVEFGLSSEGEFPKNVIVEAKKLMEDDYNKCKSVVFLSLIKCKRSSHDFVSEFNRAQILREGKAGIFAEPVAPLNCQDEDEEAFYMIYNGESSDCDD